METFFIVGLPRSRTAWLANFLTHGNSHCFHDGLRFCNSFAEVKPLFESAGTPIVGNADSSLILFLPKMLELYPNSKVLIIDRKWEEVAASLDQMGLPAPIELFEMFERFKLHSNYPVISYKDLSAEGVCAWIVNYLTGAAFNRKRYSLLKDLNVQTVIGEGYFDSMKQLMSEG